MNSQVRTSRASNRLGWRSIFLLLLAVACPVWAQDAALSGAALYRAACAACHAADGTGAPRAVVGFDTPIPDFTDCAFTTSEADFDWNAVLHLGGATRALDRKMPAFGEALNAEQIQGVIDHVRGFCTSRAWPHGDLNFPRPLVTEKAFPENEAFARVSAPFENFIETLFVYEQRIGPRSQVELGVPFNVHRAFGAWQRGLGDISVGFKHVLVHSRARGAIVSAGSDMTFPTGKENLGLGGRLRVLDLYGAYGQMLPADGFLQLQVGLEAPLNIGTATDEFYWRAAIGKTFVQGKWGRTWSPMTEILGLRELYADGTTDWYALPQMQVTLSRRQHVSASAGVRLPLNLRARRRPVFMAYLLWDWYDGDPFEGWR